VRKIVGSAMAFLLLVWRLAPRAPSRRWRAVNDIYNAVQALSWRNAAYGSQQAASMPRGAAFVVRARKATAAIRWSDCASFTLLNLFARDGRAGERRYRRNAAGWRRTAAATMSGGMRALARSEHGPLPLELLLSVRATSAAYLHSCASRMFSAISRHGGMAPAAKNGGPGIKYRIVYSGERHFSPYSYKTPLL